MLRLRWRILQKSQHDPITGCWNWMAARYPNGYGALKIDGKVVGAHRAAYMAFNGDIPSGMEVMHACDNRQCCSPSHLSVGTRSDNMRDMVRKGRNTGPRKVPEAAHSTLRNEALSHREAADALGISRDQARAWRSRLGIDRKRFSGPVEAWKRRKPAIYIDDESGSVVPETWWPGDPAPTT